MLLSLQPAIMVNPILSNLIVATSSVFLLAQGVVSQATKPATSDTPHLTATTSSSVSVVAAGDRLSLFVAIVPKPKMHVYAPEQTTYIPVSLQLSPQRDVTARPAIFPKGESLFFAPTSETQIVYSQPFRIELPVTVARGRAAGPLAVTATLEYQACDDRVCYVPRKVAVNWALTVR